MPSHVHHFDAQTFEETVLESARPVLVDFHADWCLPCRVLDPTIEALAADFAGRAAVGKVDVDANAPLAERFGVRSIPTVLLFAGGEVARRFVGISSKAELARALDDLVDRSAA